MFSHSWTVPGPSRRSVGKGEVTMWRPNGLQANRPAGGGALGLGGVDEDGDDVPRVQEVPLPLELVHLHHRVTGGARGAMGRPREGRGGGEKIEAAAGGGSPVVLTSAQILAVISLKLFATTWGVGKSL